MTVSWDSGCESRPLGLSSAAALAQLHAQISVCLQQHRNSKRKQDQWQGMWSRCFLHHNMRWSSLHWPGVLLTMLCAFSLLMCHTLSHDSDLSALIGGCAVLFLLLAGMVAMGTLQWLKSEEMPQRVENLLSTIQEVLQHPSSTWLDSTEELFAPPSSSISLQWAYRDGRLVNLPISLLVEGDIISLRPGREAPTELRGVQGEEHVVLSRGDIFSHFSSPPSPLDSERPRPHLSLQPQLFRVTETPAVELVKRCLELSQSRPVSVLDNERFSAQSLLERGIAPTVLVLLFVQNLLRYMFSAPGVGPWPVTLLQLPVNGVLPLLPLTFPLLWLLVCVYGEVRVLLQMDPQPKAWWVLWMLTCRRCVSALTGSSPTLCHTASLLHSLGSLTVLCCVDKQGVLSWPSPNPEKVLFFSKSEDKETQKQRERNEGIEMEDREKLTDTIPPRPTCVLEMLSLSAGRSRFDDIQVQFDDTRWRRHAQSLRPLGLATQLLLCKPGVTTRVLGLTDHLTHVALLRMRPSCQPVSPPWGLCTLSKILGFTPSVQEPFQQKMTIAAYTLPKLPCSVDTVAVVSPSTPPSVSMRMLPFSHLIGLLVHHIHTGSLQLFSYGSADVILGACTELWDGEELQTLSDSDRMKVVDVYQRSCVAGQCVAISFKPLLQPYDPNIDGTCMELPLNHTAENTEDSCVSVVGQQVFLGLVASQYQTRAEVVRLISGLDSACIRFVYFSSEEEVKSKVFAERMGLETGWNCHISLQSESFPLEADALHRPERGEGVCLLSDDVREGLDTRGIEGEGACLLEDLNRAKLPRGIENVRPHLENTDNVPLLVPLFTDCTSQTVCEMVCVMQEHGEVVCCLGSSQNINNNAVFLQSDISLALEPLVPTSCCSSSIAPQRPDQQSPHQTLSELSSAICGLACTLHLSQQDNSTIIKLIRQARHTTAGIRKCFLFLLQCQLSLVLIQILACVCQLPPPLGTSDVLFLSCLCFPLLSISLLGKPSDSSIMKVPTGKNIRFLPRKTMRFFVLCFLVKFGLTVSTYLACFGLLLHGLCREINLTDTRLCHPALLMNSTVASPDWFGKHFDGLHLAQKVVSFLVLLNAMCTSISHVHRSAPVWKQSPLSNHCWCVVICTVPVLYVAVVVGSRVLRRDPPRGHVFRITDVSIATWLLGILWLIPLIIINEGIKLHEMRVRVRYQKRQKLQFDTKLGMNSPF